MNFIPQVEDDLVPNERIIIANLKSHAIKECIDVCGDEEIRYYILEENGILHRLDGPAVIETRNANTPGGGYIRHAWYRYGKFHRTDGPAHYYSNNKYEPIWCVNDSTFLKSDLYNWAKEALKFLNLPHDEEAAKSHLKKVLAKISNEEI